MSDTYESIGPIASLNTLSLDPPRKKILGIPTFAWSSPLVIHRMSDYIK